MEVRISNPHPWCIRYQQKHSRNIMHAQAIYSSLQGAPQADQKWLLERRLGGWVRDVCRLNEAKAQAVQMEVAGSNQVQFTNLAEGTRAHRQQLIILEDSSLSIVEIFLLFSSIASMWAHSSSEMNGAQLY